MSPFDPARFVKGNTCLPCCTVPVPGCGCALFVNPFEGPSPDYASAQAVIADAVYNCFAYYRLGGDGGVGNVFTATWDGVTLAVHADAAFAGGAPGLSPNSFYSIALKAGNVLSAAFTFSTDGSPPLPLGVTMELRSCADGSVIDSDTSSAGAGTLHVTAPADGEYYLLLEAQGGLGPSFVNSTWSVTNSATWVINPAIAPWDDSGTTRDLWACPKFLIPIQTESTGTWYADCSAALADIADFVVSCLAYIVCSPNVGSRSVTGGSSLDISGTATDPGPTFAPAVSGAGGFNALGGDTISLAYAVSSDDTIGVDFVVTVFDDAGLVVYSNAVSGGASYSGTFTFAAPYSGRYTVSYGSSGSGNASTLTASLTVTSSGTMSSNPVQARYDAGLTCPATLDCGGACP